MGSCPNAHLGYGFRLSDDDQEKIENFSFSEKEALRIQYGIDFELPVYKYGPTFVLISNLHYSVDWDSESVIVKMQDIDTNDAVETLKKFCSDLELEFQQSNWHLFTYYG